MKLVMLDNYDSFTYNIVQYLQMLGAEVQTFRNNRTTPDAVLGLGADALVLSPGPGKPSEAGILTDLIRAGAREKIPMLGVCLGHQAIGEVFGMKVIHAKRVMHGKASDITTDGRGIFAGLPEKLSVIRYHSLALDPEKSPPARRMTAKSWESATALCRLKACSTTRSRSFLKRAWSSLRISSGPSGRTAA